ncbi:MAG: hypothetical protein V1784_05390 [bacterium]
MSGWRMLVLAICLGTNVAFAQAPDTLWTRVYGGNGNEAAVAVHQTTDSGFVVVGSTSSFGAGIQDFYLLRTDVNGDTLWTHTYGGATKDQALSVRQTSDGGYIMAGITDPAGSDSGNVYVIKTDAAGTVTWPRTFGGSYYDAGICVRQTTDGGFVVAGATGTSIIDLANALLLKLNSAGTQSWSRNFGGLGADFASAVEQTSDGGYILAGFTAPFLSLIGDVYLIKTNSSGTQTWSRTFGGDSVDIALSVLQTSDGGYILAGLTKSFGAGGNDAYVIKTNSSGDSLWTRTYGGSAADYASSIQPTADGNYIIAGGTESFGVSGSAAYLIKINGSGDTLWTKIVDEPGGDSSAAVQQTFDGDFIVVGGTNSYGPDSSNVWLFKLTECSDPTPLTPQLVITLAGEDIQLFWNPITQSVADCPIQVDHYDVYTDTLATGGFSTLLGASADTSFTHVGAIFEPNLMRFYLVKAVR